MRKFLLVLLMAVAFSFAQTVEGSFKGAWTLDGEPAYLEMHRFNATDTTQATVPDATSLFETFPGTQYKDSVIAGEHFYSHDSLKILMSTEYYKFYLIPFSVDSIPSPQSESYWFRGLDGQTFNFTRKLTVPAP